MDRNEFWKAVVSNYVMLLATLVLFFSCMYTGIRGTEPGPKVFLAVAAIVLGLIFYLIAKCFSKKGKSTGFMWYLMNLLGNALTIGGCVAVISPLIALLAELFKKGNGFVAWICLSILIAASIGIFIAMIKTAFYALKNLDLATLVLSLMLALAGIYGIIPCMQAAMHNSPLVGFGCFIALFGGAGLSLKSQTIKSDSVIYDAYGNPHYVLAHISPNRVLCTDGYSWRREADDHFTQY